MLIELCSPVDLELIEMSQALNRIVGEEVVATVALPPFPASIKDGYAVHSADGAGTRRVRAAVVAGSSNSALSGQFEAADWRLKHSNRKSPNLSYRATSIAGFLVGWIYIASSTFTGRFSGNHNAYAAHFSATVDL